ncbi:2-hydroxychromene-2-carboxylate isomerase [Leisingera sp. F5]|uniref:2-hydroxychromene-2-carboxylate isomerase n=1 Tax=Leisingera sp. F5 TaxID=1813816 RepID=UPI000AD8B245|nr:2-hydroxychromene-2-carboxylate isomerase [Leisingera sp. F5]
MPELDFWYSIGSTYSYLTVMRITDAAAQAGVSVRWRPFNVRHVMTVQNNVPFKDKPEKTAYMWRDIERRAQHYGFHPRLPAPYPLPDLVLANQVAALGAAEGWSQAYTQAAYRCWFEAGQPAGEDPNLTASLEASGQDPARAIAAAQSEPVIRALSEATEEAMALGIFGAPSFAVSGEIFWGDDRLEDALLWAQGGG